MPIERRRAEHKGRLILPPVDPLAWSTHSILFESVVMSYLLRKHTRAARTRFRRLFLGHSSRFFLRSFAVFSVSTPGTRNVAPKDSVRQRLVAAVHQSSAPYTHRPTDAKPPKTIATQNTLTIPSYFPFCHVGVTLQEYSARNAPSACGRWRR